MNPGGNNLNYGDFVRILAQEHRGLVNLSELLDQENPVSEPSITIIDYPRQHADLVPITSAFETNKDYTNLPSDCCGRIIFIEDIHGPLIEHLGSQLDVDPFFFAGHIGPGLEGAVDLLLASSRGSLPSHIVRTGKLHISYKRALDLGDIYSFDNENHHHFETVANIKRKVHCLPYSLGQKQLAILSGRCSVALKQVQNGWIAVILIDPPISAVRHKVKQSASAHIIDCREIHWKFTFNDLLSYSSFKLNGFKPDPGQKSIQERIIYSFLTDPPGFLKTEPTILNLSYYPLKFAIVESVRHVKLMFRYLHHYNYLQENPDNHFTYTNIYTLDNLRSRTYMNLYRLELLEKLLTSWKGRELDSHPQAYIDLRKDISDLSIQTLDLARALDQKMQLVTSMIQLLDAKRSIDEAIYVKRLTYTALVFVPLSWLASLFSMNDDYGPSGTKFWIYFVTAIPLLAFILLVSTVQVDHIRDRGVNLVKTLEMKLSKRRKIPNGKEMIAPAYV